MEPLQVFNEKERTSLCDPRSVEPSGVCVSLGLCVHLRLVCKRVFSLGEPRSFVSGWRLATILPKIRTLLSTIHLAINSCVPLLRF